MIKTQSFQDSYMTDVLIVGGGTSGVAAALAVAELKGKAIIVEKHQFLGGQASLGLLDTVCGLPYPVIDSENDLASSQFVRKFLSDLAQLSATKIESKMDTQENKLTFLPYRSEKYIKMIYSQLQNHNSITIFTQSYVLSIQQSDNLASQAEVLLNKQEVKIRFKSLVDCSGEATAVSIAGGRTFLPHYEPDRWQQRPQPNQLQGKFPLLLQKPKPHPQH